MAGYTVTHACGHVATHQLLGNMRERDRKLAWLGDEPCAACRGAAAAEAQAERLAGIALPALAGSPKQVSWAGTIRADKLDALRQQFDATIAKMPAARAQEGEALAGRMLAALAAQPSAAWWIDRRDLTLRDLQVIAGQAVRVA